jgi:hypothetical protein
MFENRWLTVCCQWLCTHGITLDGWRIYSWSLYLDEDLSLRYHSPTNRTRYKTKHVFDMTFNANWKPQKCLRLHLTRWHLALHLQAVKVSRKNFQTHNTTWIKGYLIQRQQTFVFFFSKNAVGETTLDDGMAVINLTDSSGTSEHDSIKGGDFLEEQTQYQRSAISRQNSINRNC